MAKINVLRRRMLATGKSLGGRLFQETIRKRRTSPRGTSLRGHARVKTLAIEYATAIAAYRREVEQLAAPKLRQQNQREVRLHH
ncbi:MAG TPA: hypothetical protein VKU19_01870 [Bryobacteraceae bacterium]|nr:hypothetical protein [Bryobacteraceae bacterium]